jgi:hypothetical protein
MELLEVYLELLTWLLSGEEKAGYQDTSSCSRTKWRRHYGSTLTCSCTQQRHFRELDGDSCSVFVGKKYASSCTML